MKDPRLMKGEELRTEARKHDKALGAEIDRLRLSDERFREILDRSLALEDEINRRRNT